MRLIIKTIAILAIFVFSSYLYAEKPTQESVTRLYVATFERAPDKAGLDYWVNNSGLNLEGIAESFFDQPETQQTYPSGTSNHEFIKSVYEHLFNREPDSAGWQYWEDELNQNHIKKSQFILAIINGALATTGDKNDADILNNKTEVGLYFTDNGLNDINFAKDVMSGISSDYQTVQNAKDKIASVLHYPGSLFPKVDENALINSTNKDTIATETKGVVVNVEPIDNKVEIDANSVVEDLNDTTGVMKVS